ncbi:13761_t:CDS:2, partial [Dentiscutata erythropus]
MKIVGNIELLHVSKQDDDYSAYNEAIEELKKEKGKNLNTVFRNYSSRSNEPIENLYTRLRDYNSSIDIDAFKRHVCFIIKLEGEPIDPCIEIDNGIKTDFDSDSQIESSTQQQNNYKYSENFNKSKSESKLLDLYSDDFENTKKQKKGKFRAINEFKVNHQKLNNNSKHIHESEKHLLSENDLFEDNILNISEDSL